MKWFTQDRTPRTARASTGLWLRSALFLGIAIWSDVLITLIATGKGYQEGNAIASWALEWGAFGLVLLGLSEWVILSLLLHLLSRDRFTLTVWTSVFVTIHLHEVVAWTMTLLKDVL